MCLNQILKDEQITLMRYSQSTESCETKSLRRKLTSLEHLLKAHPYPHRPYSRRNLDTRRSGPSRSGLPVWENEGGAL